MFIPGHLSGFPPSPGRLWDNMIHNTKCVVQLVNELMTREEGDIVIIQLIRFETSL